jgi:hypothetical protein
MFVLATVAGVERALLLPLRDPPLALLGLVMSLVAVGVGGFVPALVGESDAGVLLPSWLDCSFFCGPIPVNTQLSLWVQSQFVYGLPCHETQVHFGLRNILQMSFKPLYAASWEIFPSAGFFAHHVQEGSI